ncbi:MAG: hypothetical protein HY859_07025 [Caulobacterales bacterium]|nr:hypothetical protein [Caulobacterales bacterium]
MKATPGTLARVAAAIAFATALSAPGAASAQTCSITGGSYNDMLGSVGSVKVFGDLKVRIVNYWYASDRYWIQIDVKAGGQQLNGIQLRSDDPARVFTFCGQEVSIAMNSGSWGTLIVGVF